MLSTMEYRARHRTKRVIWGGVLIAVGCVVLLDRYDVIALDNVWHLWPVFLALSGLIDIATARRVRQVAKGAFLIVLAAWLYACLEHLWGWTFGTTWPIILIAYGVIIVAGGLFHPDHQSRKESAL